MCIYKCKHPQFKDWELNLISGNDHQYEHIASMHYNDVIMSTAAFQITSFTIVYSTVYSRRRSKKTSKFRVTGLCEGKSPVTSEFFAQRAGNAEKRKIFPFDDVISTEIYRNLYR